MTNLFSVLLTGALVLGAGAQAMAGTPRVNAREHRQQHRIAHGVASGELTAREFVRLEARQAKIRRHERRAKADGTVTFAERVRLNRALNRSSRQIHRQKHD